MAKYFITDTTLKGIADSIREKTSTTEPIKASEMPSKINEVFEVGFNHFIDLYQDYGNRVDYSGAFMGPGGWTEENFKLIHDVKPIKAYMMFRNFPFPLDLVDYAEKQGIVFDFSQCTEFNYAFSNGNIVRVGVIDTTASKGALGGAFQSAKTLETIEKIILPSNTPNTQSNGAFMSTIALKNLVFEGEIKVNGYNFNQSTSLTNASLLSILKALTKDASLASGKTITFAIIHEEIINSDVDLLEQYNLAINAGWQILFSE